MEAVVRLGVWLPFEQAPAERRFFTGTTARSYFSRLADAETFGWAATLETYRRGTERAGVVCAVLDGAVWRQGFVDLHRPDAVRILDFPQAVEHRNAAAGAVFGAGTPAAQTSLTAQAHILAHGDPDQVRAALTALPVARAPVPAEAGRVRDAVLGSLTTRRAQIAYADFRVAGYPIGSGAVERAHKLVVEARLTGSGMHWARPHVNPMAALRAVACSGRWEALWPHIYRQMVDLAGACRRQRQHARRAARLPKPPDARPRPSRPPQTSNGRPTEHHPWKRPLLAGGLRHNQRHAKT